MTAPGGSAAAGRAADRPARRRPGRDQRGLTLLETVLGLGLAAMMLVPMLGWAQFAFGEQAAVKARNLSGSGLGILRTWVQRDVTGADAVWLSGDDLVDCAGGEGADGDLLMVVGDGTFRRVYSLVDGGESLDLYRRSCGTPGGEIAESLLVVADVNRAGTSVECSEAVALDGSCRRPTFRVTTSTLSQASISATVRADRFAGVLTDPLVSESAPMVALTADPTEGGRGMTVDFSSEGTVDPLGGTLSFAWEFGDGATSSEPNPSHTYTAIGSHTALLTVTSSAGIPATDFVVIEVGNRAPEANIASPASGTEVFRGEPVVFSAEGSNDDADAEYGGRIASYLWEFGDGTSSDQPEVTKAYQVLSPSAGFVVRLTVTDDQGRSHQAQVRVKVLNREPSVEISADPPGGSSPLQVTLTAAVTDETTMGANPPLTYEWDLGNGSTSTAASPTVTYTGSGTRTISLTVTDDAGATASDTTTIELTRKPTAAFTVSPSSGRAPVSVSITNTTSDPDGNAASWAWDFGNGTTSTQRHPGSRTFSVSNPSSDTFTGATYTVRLTVTDTSGGTSTTTRTVTVSGAPAPSSLGNSRSGTTQNYSWSSVSNVNRYELRIDFTSGGCSDRTVSTSGTSTSINYGGSPGNTCARRTHDMYVRSRDATTGKWGAWSSPRRVN